MGFNSKIYPVGGDHSGSGRVGHNALLNFAPSSECASPNQASYNQSPTEVAWSGRRVIGCRGGLLYLRECSRDNSLCFLLADSCRRIFGVGLLVSANVQCTGARESKKRIVLLPYWFSDFRPDRDYASGRWSASLPNGFPLAFAGLSLSWEIRIHATHYKKSPAPWWSCLWFRGSLPFCRERP